LRPILLARQSSGFKAKNIRPMSEIIHEDAPAAKAWLAWLRAPWLKFAIAVIEPMSVAGLFVFMLAKSWLRWSDPLVDFPRDLYIAWRLSAGDLLYQKIANWYGPLANLVEGLGFKIFGVGLDTIVWMNIALTVVILLLLRGIFGLIGNRWMVWLSSVTFVGVFMVGHYTQIANFNFITPYVAQSAYGFLGLLLVLWGLLKHLKSEKFFWLMVAGFGFAVAYLDKPEAILAASGSLGIYFFAQMVHSASANGSALDIRSGWRWLRKSLGWFFSGFLSLWLPVLIYFWTVGGFAYALRAVNYAVVFSLKDNVRHAIMGSPAMQSRSGFDHPWQNFLLQLELGAGLVLICAVIIAAGWAWARAEKYGRAWWLWLLALAVLTGMELWFTIWVDANFFRALVFPVVLSALGYSMASLRLARRNHAEFSRTLGVALLGVAAGLMLTRVFLNPRLIIYGFIMLPLALFFWFHLVMVEAPRVVSRGGRAGWPVAVAFSSVLLFGTAFLAKANLEICSRMNYPVGEGRDRFYTTPPEIYSSGYQLNLMVACFRQFTPKAKTLVAFPEGIAVNYLLRVPSPLSELEFRPVPLNYVGVPQVLEELQAHPPEAVFLFAADFKEDHVAYFGADEASGRGIVNWLNQNYSLVIKWNQSDKSITGDGVNLLLPKIPNDKRPPLLPSQP